MRHSLSFAIALALAAPAFAQDTFNSTSGSASNATANNASTSGSASDQTQGQQQQANNAGIGNSTSTSGSNSTSNAATESNASSFGNEQGQSQGQNANNSQAQMQGQTASNMQGTTVTNTFNTTSRKKTVQEFRTNNAVPLAASSSFSSDYCGGTASGGASAAPLGISIGGAAPVFDKSCQSLRRAEKFGMAAANAMNMQQPELAGKLMAMMVWSICTSDSTGPRATASTADACEKAALLGPQAGTNPSPGQAVETKVTAQQVDKARQDAAQGHIPETATAVAVAAVGQP